MAMDDDFRGYMPAAGAPAEDYGDFVPVGTQPLPEAGAPPLRDAGRDAAAGTVAPWMAPLHGLGLSAREADAPVQPGATVRIPLQTGAPGTRVRFSGDLSATTLPGLKLDAQGHVQLPAAVESSVAAAPQREVGWAEAGLRGLRSGAGTGMLPLAALDDATLGPIYHRTPLQEYRRAHGLPGGGPPATMQELALNEVRQGELQPGEYYANRWVRGAQGVGQMLGEAPYVVLEGETGGPLLTGAAGAYSGYKVRQDQLRRAGLPESQVEPAAEAAGLTSGLFHSVPGGISGGPLTRLASGALIPSALGPLSRYYENRYVPEDRPDLLQPVLTLGGALTDAALGGLSHGALGGRGGQRPVPEARQADGAHSAPEQPRAPEADRPSAAAASGATTVGDGAAPATTARPARSEAAPVRPPQVSDEEHQLGAAAAGVEKGALDRDALSAVAHLLSTDADAAARLHAQHADDEAAFVAAVKERIHANQQAAEAGALSAGGAGDHAAPRQDGGAGQRAEPGGAAAEVGQRLGRRPAVAVHDKALVSGAHSVFGKGETVGGAQHGGRTVDGILPETSQGDDSLAAGPGAATGRFADLPGEHEGPRQAYDDAAALTGLRLDMPVIHGPADMDSRVPMRYSLADRRIQINPGVTMSRAEAARFMAEELLHAVDHLGGRRTVSGGSTRLDLKTGDIAQEALQRFKEGKEFHRELRYPLADQDMSDGRMRAELFARLGTLYFADPEAMRRVLPLAHGAFDEQFRLTGPDQESPDFIQGKVWTGASWDVQARSGQGDIGRVLSGSQAGGGFEHSDRLGQLPPRVVGQAFRLGDLRNSIARSFGSPLGGGRVRLDDLESSVASGDAGRRGSGGIGAEPVNDPRLARPQVPPDPPETMHGANHPEAPTSGASSFPGGTLAAAGEADRSHGGDRPESRAQGDDAALAGNRDGLPIREGEDVGLAAGMSEDGRTSVHDAAMPRWYEAEAGRRFDLRESRDYHERVEKALLDAGHTYPEAHRAATEAEHARMRQMGFDPNAVEAHQQPHIDRAAHRARALGNTTPEVTAEPYIDSGELGMRRDAPADPRFVLDRDGERYTQPLHGKLLERIETVSGRGADGRYAVMDPHSAKVLSRGDTPEQARAGAQRLAARLGRRRLQQMLDAEPALSQQQLRERFKDRYADAGIGAEEQAPPAPQRPPPDESTAVRDNAPPREGRVVSGGGAGARGDVEVEQPVSPGRKSKIVDLQTRNEFRAASLNIAPTTIYRYDGRAYATDALSRGVSTSGILKRDPGHRFHDDRKIGHQGEEGDIGFHAGADRFGFQGGPLNVSPGNAKLNSREYKDFEDHLARLVTDPRNNVYAEFQRVFHPGNNSIRPDAYRVIYRVNDGPLTKVIFRNKPGG